MDALPWNPVFQTPNGLGHEDTSTSSWWPRVARGAGEGGGRDLVHVRREQADAHQDLGLEGAAECQVPTKAHPDRANPACRRAAPRSPNPE